MSFTVACECGKSFRVKKANVGKKATCPVCGHKLELVPQLETVGSGSTCALPSSPTRGGRFSNLVCTECGAAVAADASICVNCGLNLVTGQYLASAAPDASEARSLGARQITFSDIFRLTMDSGALRVAVTLMLWTVLWTVCLVIFDVLVSKWAIAAAGFGENQSQGARIVRFLLIIHVLFSIGFSAWYWSKLFEVASSAEADLDSDDRPHDVFVSFLRMVAVCVIAFAPLVAAALLPGAIAAPLLIGALLWPGIYLPMGVAVAGAYRTANPVRVVAAIQKTLGGYLMVLTFSLPFMLTAWLVWLLASRAGMRLIAGPTPGPVAVAIVTLVASCAASLVSIYLAVVLMAILGTLLQKYRQPRPVESSEWGPAWIWVGGAAAAAALLIMIHVAIAF